MTDVFAALAHPARRRMLDLLVASPGMTIAGLATHFEMSGVGVLKHVKVLAACRLITSRRVGRVRRLYFNLVPIQQIHERWSDAYGLFWASRMVEIKNRVESKRRGKVVRRA